MKESINTIEKKISSVHKISKITKAMKIIATMRFQTALKQVKDSQNFLSVIDQIFPKLQCLLEYEELNLPQSQAKDSAHKLWLVFASDLGLCGAYNHNLFQKIRLHWKKNDLLVVVGKKAINFFHYLDLKIIKEYDTTNFIHHSLDEMVKWLRDNFQVLFNEIVVVYTAFVSSMVQNVLFQQLLPITTTAITKPKGVIADFLIEPSASTVYQHTLCLYLKSLLLVYYWNAKASEEKIRQIAMESASDNAQDMTNDLKLKYNQLRQEKITKEIILVSQDS